MENNKNKYLIRGIKLILITFLLFNISCNSKYKKAIETLPQKDRHFIKSVRYLITKKEKKVFIYLDAKNRSKFILDFWKKRDPTPDTELNEYKETYYQRMQKANKLFVSSGKNGWLTDRGRTYILYGPPDMRKDYPTGYSFYSPPVEVWHYGMFPIIFVDKYNDGDYRITYPSLNYLQQIFKTEMVLQDKYKVWNKTLVGKINIIKSENNNYIIQADIPYKGIVFHKNKKNYTGILLLEIKIDNKTKIRTIKKYITIRLSSQKIKNLPDLYKLRETFSLNRKEDTIKVKITDKTTGSGIYKVLKLKN